MLQQFSLTEKVDVATPEQAWLTDDSVEILRFATDALAAGMEAALVTLVETRGGGARSPGAQMAVREDGLYCGYVSGGCVEAAAAWEALEAIREGCDRTVVYGKGSPWFDIVLPCGGSITLRIHPLRTAQPLLTVLNALNQRRSASLRYHPLSQTLHAVHATGETGWRSEAFDIVYRPCTRAVIYGRSVEADATAKLAQAAGYDVHLSSAASVGTTASLIDAQTAVILLYHDLDRELPVLQVALAATPFYIGALGSRRTHDERVRRLIALGYSAQEIARIKAPIGIFPKARDASSLALSVLADIAAARLNGFTGAKPTDDHG